MMVWHGRVAGHCLAHAVRALRLGSTRHRHRPESRDEHNQQEKSCNAAVSPPHLRTAYQYPCPVASTRQTITQQTGPLEIWVLSTGCRFLYHFSVHELAERLLQTIRKQHSMRAGDRVAAAVSGGADSVALLCLLLELRAELGIALSVAHVNHQLRGGESDEDEQFVAKLAGQHGLELHVRQARVRTSHNSTIGSGIEAAARDLRYGFFRDRARECHVTRIATAHTLDDQAETVLLRIFRGTGVRGLSGIHPRIIFQEQGREFGQVLRPLLGFRRVALQKFLREQDQNWREDSSNRDIAFLRNRVRQRLLPMIADEFGEAAIEHMGELAEIARAEEEHWERDHPEITPLLAAEDVEAATRPEPHPLVCLQIRPLLALSLAARRRFVRAWLEMNAPEASISFRLIEEALELARSSECRKSADKQIKLPGGWSLRFSRQHSVPEFFLERRFSLDRDGKIAPPDYEYTLPVPGTVEVRELGARVTAQRIEVSRVPEEDRSQLLDPQRMPKAVLIRNWRPGDRYWPAHTAAGKKVKEWLSDRHATGAQKKLWPVAVVEGDGLVWMRGFAVPAAWCAPPSASRAIWIREIRA